MTTLFKTLFSNRLTEEIDQGSLPKTGLISPYSVSRPEVNALAILELEDETRQIGYAVTNTYKKCSPAINLIKKMDLEGFLTFKSRIKETFQLNNILEGNETLQEQLSEIFTWAYAEVSKRDSFLIFSDEPTAKLIALAIYSKAEHVGLKLPQGKISQLFQNVLITVLTKLKH